MITLKQLRQRRDKFIAILNTTKPDWKGQIDKSRLDMSYCEDCILGQLYGRYTYGMLDLELNNEQAVEYALQIEKAYTPLLSDIEEERLLKEYDKLTKVWKEVL